MIRSMCLWSLWTNLLRRPGRPRRTAGWTAVPVAARSADCAAFGSASRRGHRSAGWCNTHLKLRGRQNGKTSRPGSPDLRRKAGARSRSQTLRSTVDNPRNFVLCATRKHGAWRNLLERAIEDGLSRSSRTPRRVSQRINLGTPSSSQKTRDRHWRKPHRFGLGHILAPCRDRDKRKDFVSTFCRQIWEHSGSLV